MKLHLYRYEEPYCNSRSIPKEYMTEYPFYCTCKQCLKAYIADLKKYLENLK